MGGDFEARNGGFEGSLDLVEERVSVAMTDQSPGTSTTTCRKDDATGATGAQRPVGTPRA
jgi:hypothetical protein